MKKCVGMIVVSVVIILTLLLFANMPVAKAGEKEELQSKLVALLQEERAINAEFQLYQAKLQDIQQRFPEVKKEQKVLQDKLKAIEEKEKAAKPAPEKKAPDKPAVGK